MADTQKRWMLLSSRDVRNANYSSQSVDGEADFVEGYQLRRLNQ